VDAKVTQFAYLSRNGKKRVDYLFSFFKACGNAYSPKSKSDIALNLARSSVERMIDMVSNVGSKDPIVGAIAKQVAHRHGSMGEPMNK
jgi:hypothetical protein